jgi:hypothetical protein
VTAASGNLTLLTRGLHVVMALAAALIAASGCSSKPTVTAEQRAQADLAAYEMQIRNVVQDPARANRLVTLADEFNKLAWQSIARVNDYRARVAALNSNYEATREDYQALLTQQNAVSEVFVEKAFALREQMAALTTDAEWEELTKARLPVLETALQELLS